MISCQHRASLLLLVLSALMSTAVHAASEKEAELIKLLQSDAPKADKALACKHLAVYGSGDAVPELAKLLSDEQLASWSRIALEAIPGGEADEALRNALPTLEGRLLVGVINSIGVRQDAEAVEPLTARLTDPDAEVASAAAVAIGRVGNVAAAKALRSRLATAPADVRSAVAEGCILCAERAFADSRAEDAVEIYDEVREADVPRPRIREATRGAILARGPEGIPLLVEQLNSPDEDLFQIGLSTAREFPGDKIDAALAAEMARAVPVRAALLVHAMADRPKTVVLSAVLKAAERGPQPVRLAAIGALARVGNASCLSSLLEIALEDDEALQQVAKQTLAELPGETINKDIVRRLDKAEGDGYPLLLELVGLRRIDALPPLLKALKHPDQPVRSAALTSLGNIVPFEKLSVLISQVVKPEHEDDAATARLALKTACVRMPDREACAAELTKAMDRAPAATKVALLEILGAVGGTNALEAVYAAARSSDPALQDLSSQLLGEWRTIDAAAVLLDLATTSEKYKVRAQRGYIRIARQFQMPPEQRLEMCRHAFRIARQPAEQKLVLEVLRRNPHVETLKLAVKAMQEYTELKEESTQTVLAIATSPKLGDSTAEAGELLAQADLGRVKLEILQAEYGAGDARKDVTETLKKLAGDGQFIKLPTSDFNEVFGGDPAPGTAKQLKIRYRLDGKPGEATFAEKTLLVLPVPK